MSKQKMISALLHRPYLVVGSIHCYLGSLHGLVDVKNKEYYTLKKTVNARVWAILPRGITAKQMLVVKRNKHEAGRHNAPSSG